MILYKQALDILHALPTIQTSEWVPLDHALGRALAQDISASSDLPLFDNSAVDGIAIRMRQLHEPVKIDGTRFAAPMDDAFEKTSTSAIRIMTGAKVPKWAETIVPVEYIQVIQKDPELVQVQDSKKVKLGANIRKRGEDFKMGDPLFKIHHTLTPESLMVLASFGMDRFKVLKKPKIWLATTGDEIKEPGESIKEGEVYNTSGIYLKSQLHRLGLNISYQCHLKDQVSQMTSVLTNWLESPAPSLLITTGAVSMGERDELPNIAKKLGLTIHFHRCAIRPGKPVLFASNGSTHRWIGAPGNAISTAICWTYFIRPLLNTWAKIPLPNQLTAPVTHEIPKPKGLRTFYRGYFNGQSVTIPPEQGSQRLKASVASNVIAELPEDSERIASGTPVTCTVL